MTDSSTPAPQTRMQRLAAERQARARAATGLEPLSQEGPDVAQPQAPEPSQSQACAPSPSQALDLPQPQPLESAHWPSCPSASTPPQETDADAPTPPHRYPRCRTDLRRRLGLPTAAGGLTAAQRRHGWIVTILAGVVAALTRLLGLSHPRSLMFDEIYYVKDAYALWHNGYESVWAKGADTTFAAGDMSGLTSEPSFIVHPQLGKWLIAVGMHIAGPDASWGWRLAPALAGILTVILLTRLTLRVTASPALAGVAGLLLALDGVGITESRIALLDVFVGLGALLTVWCVMRDRLWLRERLADSLEGTLASDPVSVPWLRPWLLAAGLSVGATCAVKWSGAYVLAAVVVLVAVWDVTALRAVGERTWLTRGLTRCALVEAGHLVAVALVTYVASWWSWFAHAGAYKHGWAAQMRAAGTPVRAWLPDSLNDLLEYHLSMYHFHVTLESEHPYMSHPAGWLLQIRPTSFYWKDFHDVADSPCGTGHCVQAITSIGNIPLWWSAALALCAALVVMAWRARDWRVWVALVGYIGLYLPWFLYSHRTIFTFYTVTFVPFVVLILTLMLGVATGWLAPVPGSVQEREQSEALAAGELGPGLPAPRGWLAYQFGITFSPTRRGLSEAWTGVPLWRSRTEGVILLSLVLTVTVLFAVAWWPLWTGQTVRYSFWHAHMLFGSWI